MVLSERHVLHDWSDGDAVTILTNCRRAMSQDPASRVLIVESVIQPGNDPGFGKWLDLMMLIIGGKERTKEEYRELLAAADLHLTRIVPTASEVSVVEAEARG